MNTALAIPVPFVELDLEARIAGSPLRQLEVQQVIQTCCEIIVVFVDPEDGLCILAAVLNCSWQSRSAAAAFHEERTAVASRCPADSGRPSRCSVSRLMNLCIASAENPSR